MTSASRSKGEDVAPAACWLACPKCDGHGEIRGPEFGMPYFPCRFCDGVGLVDEAGEPVPYAIAFAAGAV